MEVDRRWTAARVAKAVADAAKLSEPEAKHVLDALYTLRTLALKLDLKARELVSAITDALASQAGDEWRKEHLETWTRSSELIVEYLEGIGPDDPLAGFHDWSAAIRFSIVSDDQRLADRLRVATRLLHDAVEIDPSMRGGVPVLKGTRLPVAVLLGEIADDRSISEIAADLDIDLVVIRKVLEGLAIHLDRPFTR